MVDEALRFVESNEADEATRADLRDLDALALGFGPEGDAINRPRRIGVARVSCALQKAPRRRQHPSRHKGEA